MQVVLKSRLKYCGESLGKTLGGGGGGPFLKHIFLGAACVCQRGCKKDSTSLATHPAPMAPHNAGLPHARCVRSCLRADAHECTVWSIKARGSRQRVPAKAECASSRHDCKNGSEIMTSVAPPPQSPPPSPHPTHSPCKVSLT